MMPKVIVIDNNEKRQLGMAQAFWGLAEIYKCTGKSFYHLNQQLNYWEESPPLDAVDLMLIHGRDHKYKDVTQATKRIWYGGFPGMDPAAEKGEDSIYRAINTLQDVLSAEEAQEALQNLHLNNFQKEPMVFKPPTYLAQLEPILEFLHGCASCKNLNADRIDDLLTILKPQTNILLSASELESVEKRLKALSKYATFSEIYIMKLGQIREDLFSGIDTKNLLQNG